MKITLVKMTQKFIIFYLIKFPGLDVISLNFRSIVWVKQNEENKGLIKQKSSRRASTLVCTLFNSLPKYMPFAYSNKTWENTNVSEYFYLLIVFPFLLEYFGKTEVQRHRIKCSNFNLNFNTTLINGLFTF